MSITIIKEEIVDRAVQGPRGFPKATPIHSNKIVKMYGYYSNKAVVTLFNLSHHLYVHLCLPEVDLEEGQSGVRLLYMYSTQFRES